MCFFLINETTVRASMIRNLNMHILKTVFDTIIIGPGIICIVLLLSGTFFISSKKKNPGMAALLLLVSVAIYGLSTQLLSDIILRNLENRYQPINFGNISIPNNTQTNSIDIIVVPGAGLSPADSNGLPTTAMARLSAAAAIYNFKKCPIIVSGANSYPVTEADITEADLSADFLTALGVDPSLIIKEDKSTSTMENAQKAQEIIASQFKNKNVRILLVSSSIHLPRSVLSFSASGGNEILPIGADTLRIKKGALWRQLLPSRTNLFASLAAIKEYVGLAVYQAISSRRSRLPNA